MAHSSYCMFSHESLPYPSIPELQTVANLSKKFRLSESRVQATLQTLEQMGFVLRRGATWSWLKGQWHSSQADPRSFLLKQHLQDLSHSQYLETPESGLHLSVIQTLSRNDLAQLHNSIIEWIREFNQVASPSAPEVAVVFNCDLFEVSAN